VVEGSRPLNPPIAMTDLAVESSSEAAVCAEEVAATHL
jgi:hypothetical protein